jgi:hypothetical protein
VRGLRDPGEVGIKQTADKYPRGVVGGVWKTRVYFDASFEVDKAIIIVSFQQLCSEGFSNKQLKLFFRLDNWALGSV